LRFFILQQGLLAQRGDKFFHPGMCAVHRSLLKVSSVKHTQPYPRRPPDSTSIGQARLPRGNSA
jgi:hypothetical protein